MVTSFLRYLYLEIVLRDHTHLAQLVETLIAKKGVHVSYLARCCIQFQCNK